MGLFNAARVIMKGSLVSGMTLTSCPFLLFSYILPKVSCGPNNVFAGAKTSYNLRTCPYFDNLECDIFYAGGLECCLITSVTTAVRIRTLSVH